MRSEDWKFVYTCVHLTLQMPSSLVEETGWRAVSTSFLCTLTVCFRVGQHLFTAKSWTAGVESLCVSVHVCVCERERDCESVSVDSSDFEGGYCNRECIYSNARTHTHTYASCITPSRLQV